MWSILYCATATVTVAAVHYKPLVDRYTPMLGHMAIKQHDKTNFKHDWKDDFQLSYEYAGYYEHFLDMLT